MTMKLLLAVIISVAVAAGAYLFVWRQRYSHLELKSCFKDVHGLKVGATVRIAGVDVGTVRQVVADPKRGDCPAEVAMDLATSYEISVPKDATTGIATDGLLGDAYVDIDVKHAVGDVTSNYSYLQSKEGKPITALDVITGMIESAKAKEVSKGDPKSKVPTK